LVAAATLTSGALAQAQKAAPSPTAPTPAAASARKPNILVIFGDDIGQTNVSAYSHGLMGYRTPNIDRIAREGMMFTDYYAEQSCTAGRSAFITGQCTLRTGFPRWAFPGAAVGLQARDATLAELLKPLGYATGQFGKNHLGDRNEYLPTVHGFDEFVGNLYHLMPRRTRRTGSIPRDPAVRQAMGTRACCAARRRTATIRPNNRAGQGRPADDRGHWPAHQEANGDDHDETSAAAIDFMQRQARATRRSSAGSTPPACTSAPCSGLPSRPTGTDVQDRIRRRHDRARCDVGTILKAWTTWHRYDPSCSTPPTTARTEFLAGRRHVAVPQREEHQLEGSFRVPCMIRWPGRIQPGSTSNETISALDCCPTLMAVAGDPEDQGQAVEGHQAGAKTFKVHLDGYNQLPHLTGEQERSARKEFVYFDDDGDVVAVRYENWKAVFEEQRAQGTLRSLGRAVHKLRHAEALQPASGPL